MTTLDDFMNEQAILLAQSVERREGENLLRVIAKDKAIREDARTTAIVRLDMARQEINYQIGKAEKQAMAAIRRMMDNVELSGGAQEPEKSAAGSPSART